MFKRIILFFLIVAMTLSCVVETSHFELSDQFCDGMVLPKHKPVKVFGTGNGVVKVELDGIRAKCRAREGSWCVTLPAMEAGGPYSMTIVSNGYESTVSDIYVGTVLLLAGQSNIQFKMGEGSTPREEWTGDSLIRSFTMPRIEMGEPYVPADGWVRCTDGNVKDFSAIGYLVATELRFRTDEAVGLINCYQGASVIESWMPAELSEKPEYQLADEQKYKDHFVPYYCQWNAPGTLFELDIVPLAPYQVSAVVWYQGESNTGPGEYAIYPSLFSDMAASWRAVFHDETMPFIIVGIANLVGRGDGWYNLQSVQATIPDIVPNCVFVKSADVCDSLNIHPADKRALSLRIVDTARGVKKQ